MRATIIVGTIALSFAGAASFASAQVPAAVTRVRPGRLIGVYDAQSGAPLDDVTVANAANGLSARTTSTGTLSLFFVDTAGGLLRLTKIGYRPLTLLVANSDADTIPETILMEPAATRLAPVVTNARAVRGPADTVRSLELNGFYDRRQTSGAPSSAFQTSEKIERLTLLSEVFRLSGRNVCMNNLYINGARVSGAGVGTFAGRRAGAFRGSFVPNNLRKEPIDQLLTSQDVLAIEMYRSSEVPPQYNATRPPGQPDCGATLIWTK